MKKKLFILILIILTVTLCGVALSGCDVVDKGEIPVKWDSYVAELADSYYETFKLANGLYMMGFNFQIKHIANGKQSVYDGTFKITQDIYTPNISAFELDIYLTNDEQDRVQIFYFAGNNFNTYLYAKNLNGKFDIKYQFENTPTFSLYRIDLADPTIIRANMYKNLKQITNSCNVNADKSVYSLDFELKDYIISRESDINKLFGIIPSPIVDEINQIFNTNVGMWEEVLKDTSGKADINIDTSKRITDIKIYDMQSFANEDNRIEEITISDIKVSTMFYNIDRTLYKRIEENKADYFKTKIGAISVEGNLELIDSTDKRTAITYDYKFNSSIDLLALTANKFNFATLDDKNYFHFRLSHTCDINCSAFCSVNYGNKLEVGKGAVLDIAFSPKDFGTHFVYISIGVKQLISESALSQVAGGATALLQLSLPQYVLLTLDTSAYAMQNDQNTGLMLLQFLMDINTNLSIYNDHVDVDIDKMLGLAGADRSGLINSLLNIGGYNIDTARFNYSQPQFGIVTNYDIYRESIHIIDYSYSDTKNYINAINPPDPSLDWSFNDYTEVLNPDTQKSINVLNIYSIDGQSMYSDSTPLSPQEIVNLRGCYINYNYTNIFNSTTGYNQVANKGKATITDVVGIDKSKVNKYQKVYLKISLPSKWLGIADNEPLASIASQYLFVYAETYIKLTSMAVNGMVIERTDKENGTVKTNYQLESRKYSLPMLNGRATIKYDDGNIKSVDLMGSCSAVVTSRASLWTTYKILEHGRQRIMFSYAGKSSEFNVNILVPNNLTFVPKSGHNPVFKKNEELSYTDFDAYGANILYINADATENKPYRYHLDFRNYYIYGSPLNKSGAYWDTYIDSNGEAIVKFKVDGTYKVEVRAFGYSQVYNITVTSNVTGASSYSIISNNTGMTGAVNVRLYRSHYVKNKYHGISGLDNLPLITELHKGVVNSLGLISYFEKLVEGEGTYTIENLRYNGIAYDSSVPISLPESIFKAIPINFDIYFKQVGYYRLTVKLGDIYSYEYLQVVA